MFARTVRMKLKPLCAIDFSRLYERHVLPVLREQQGFRDGMTLVSGERAEAIAISFWDGRESAERFDRSAYAMLVERLEDVLAAPPEVATMAVSTSTPHGRAVAV